MTISSLLKTSLLAVLLPPALWLAGAPSGAASLAGLTAGVALVLWASARIARHRSEVAAMQAAFRVAASAPPVHDEPHGGLHAQPLQRARRRLDRTPTGRQRRDVRCPAQPALGGIARRSTRR